MGYGMSRFEINSNLCDAREIIGGGSTSQRPNESLTNLNHEIDHLTRLRSRPTEFLWRDVPNRQKFPVSTVKMLAGRECNYSGRGRFTSADRCHILGRYLPVSGPWRVDNLNTRAYVSQFSADGSLFVAGFQGSIIRIYSVDNGWKVLKEILAKSLRWTITDTSLSPDQRWLVVCGDFSGHCWRRARLSRPMIQDLHKVITEEGEEGFPLDHLSMLKQELGLGR